MGIEGLKKCQRRRSKRGCFPELPPRVQEMANRWLDRFRVRWKGNLPQWRLAILVGQAKRLALRPPTPEWGRSMLAKRGGYAVQQRYRMEGKDPTEKATRVRVLRQKAMKAQDAQKAQEAQETHLPRNWTISPWISPPDTVVKAHQAKTNRPNLPPPPSPEARQLHKLFDPPGCRCYYCAWPNHEP